jgi:hypothetical protein
VSIIDGRSKEEIEELVSAAAKLDEYVMVYFGALRSMENGPLKDELTAAWMRMGRALRPFVGT